ncbi:MAG: oxidoreductase [Clostridiales bacterium]|uniref:SDR family oxidoreductase n=1 Tax=Harryflintia acetispora TaxID=1849041 RepID=A0A9X8Y8B8_9FIRM|nr:MULTISPECIES: SDR family oxidoreductase [Oscillospiraceae]PWM38190.1 MAG: oxidoreductase [Clostridiales bacterium]PWM40167.1 MAG: oxidoreductase [Clostridiales bacterium]RGB67932.1 SDR family oxidoreductase [Harryflintia acetispora]TCL43456.1 hypothetical protein EDD78_10586 [Harryflintia acetispora]
MRYSDKLMLVTGGSNGIGREIARAYSELGAQVIVADKFGNDLDADFYRIDFADPAQTEAMMGILLDKYGDIEIIVNNVGIMQEKPIEEMSNADIWQMLNINLVSALITSREFTKNRFRRGIEKKYGRIVNIASTGYLTTVEHSEVFAASKGGLVSLTSALSATLAGYSTTVNCLSPGRIETQDYTAFSPEPHPHKKLGEPSDISRACLYLTDEANGFINGQNIIIDGGVTKRQAED